MLLLFRHRTICSRSPSLSLSLSLHSSNTLNTARQLRHQPFERNCTEQYGTSTEELRMGRYGARTKHKVDRPTDQCVYRTARSSIERYEKAQGCVRIKRRGGQREEAVNKLIPCVGGETCCLSAGESFRPCVDCPINENPAH